MYIQIFYEIKTNVYIMTKSNLGIKFEHAHFKNISNAAKMLEAAILDFGNGGLVSNFTTFASKVTLSQLPDLPAVK